MIQTIPTIQSASLHYREGSSDKVYQAAIEPKGEGYIVTFAYGRRGSTLSTGTKTSYPVSLGEASQVFDKLIASKLAKGYQYDSASAGETKPYQNYQPNHEVPAPGEVCECKYLYAFLDSGSIYQPVYLGKRCDIPANECTVDQLKYKNEAHEKSAA
jgi:bifunctional non-homologous end joining protein LigD